MTATATICDSCGQPAVYRYADSRDHHCEPCAIRYGYERRGEAYTAMKTLGFAISLLRDGGLTDGAIAGMVQVILTNPHSTAEYDIGGDEFLPGFPGRTEDRPWMVHHTPIEAA